MLWLLLAAALLSGPVGCASLTNPTADGLPARRVPRELLGLSRAGECTLPLNLLSQCPPADYLLASGDVLGLYPVEFPPEQVVPLPVHVGPMVQPRDQQRFTASAGYPVVVHADGTVDLPQAGRLSVQGMTVAQARQAVRDLYVRRDLVKPEHAGKILVSLLEPRRSSVLVLRQEATSFAPGPEGPWSLNKRGTGFEVDLPAYENDVLHALARTGGLPGLDACNEVVIYHSCFRNGQDRSLLLQSIGGVPANCDPLKALGLAGSVVRIPLRVRPGEVPAVRPEDVILQSGDVVFLEARDDQVFYTAGLLPAGVHLLPRDRDLDVLEAVSYVRGPLLNGAFGGSNLSGNLIPPGLGTPSPALLTVLRRTPGGGQVSIVVDLDRALTDPSERISVQPRDVLVLQERPDQALGRYISQAFLNFNIVWQVIHSRYATGVLDMWAPDRLPYPVINVNNTSAITR